MQYWILAAVILTLSDAVITCHGIRRGMRELNPLINFVARYTSVGFSVGVGVVFVSTIVICLLSLIGPEAVAWYVGVRSFLAWRQIMFFRHRVKV